MTEVITLPKRHPDKDEMPPALGSQTTSRVTFIHEWRQPESWPEKPYPDNKNFGAIVYDLTLRLGDSSFAPERKEIATVAPIEREGPPRTEEDKALDLVYKILDEFPQANNTDLMLEAVFFLARYVVWNRADGQSDEAISEHVRKQLAKAAEIIGWDHRTPNTAATEILNAYADNPERSTYKIPD